MAQTLEDELRLAQQALLAVELKLKPDILTSRSSAAPRRAEKRVAAHKLEGTLASRPAGRPGWIREAGARCADPTNSIAAAGQDAEEGRLQGLSACISRASRLAGVKLSSLR
jgi:hypothetical protein